MVINTDKLAVQARRFIARGAIGEAELGALAEACDGLIRTETQRSPRKAAILARRFVGRARPLGGAILATALRALGWALHNAGAYTEARDAYLEARSILAHEPYLRARVDRILIDVFMYLGDANATQKHFRLALRTFERLGERIDAAKTRVNYANVLHRQDRHREAGRQYRQAARVWEGTDDALSQAICHYNLANTLVQSFDFDEATELYLRAERVFAGLGHDLYANECRYALAWLQMLRGNYHQALTGLADCELVYQQAGHAKGVMLCLLDRAEIYLTLRLYTDARYFAIAAEKGARRLGLAYEAAKAALFASRASSAVGDRTAARKALARADAGFRETDSRAFLGVVGILSASESRNRRALSALMERARKRFADAQLPLWEAISDLECFATDPDNIPARRRLSRSRAVQVVPHLYAAWHTLLGDQCREHGRPADARKHWIQAADMLDAVRVKLPAIEARSLMSRRADDPHARLVSSLSTDCAAEAAVWSERRRTAGLWSISSETIGDDRARDEADAGLSKLAQKMATVSAFMDGKSGRGGSAQPGRTAEVGRLQREVGLRLSRLENGADRRAARQQDLLAQFEAVSRILPVIQFHCEAEDVIAFIHRDGEVIAHRYPDGRRILREHIACWQVLLSRAANATGNNMMIDLDDEQRLFDSLGKWLWTPLAECTADRVLILPEGDLANLPWAAIRIRGHALVESTRIVMSPSLRHYSRAHEIDVRSRDLNVFLGQTEGLRHCQDELSVFEGNHDHQVTIHRDCRRQDWPHNSESMIWHYLGHARFRSDNPFYSSLLLADGPLFAADFRLRRNRVGLVTLAACRTGSQTYVPGEESSGLVRSLLEMGARNVLASHWSVSDESTALWMRTFYESYLDDLSLHKSIRQAALGVRERYPSAYHWAAFSLFGAG
jgi:tetratricopeptide (TPR) repeat protein